MGGQGNCYEEWRDKTKEMERCFFSQNLVFGIFECKTTFKVFFTFSIHQKVQKVQLKKFNWLTLIQTNLTFLLHTYVILSFLLLTFLLLTYILLTFLLLTFLLLFITFFFSFYPNTLSLSWTNHREKHHVSFCLYFKTKENM